MSEAAHPFVSLGRPQPRPAQLTRPAAICRSFWLGGFEGADHVNSSGEPLSMLDITQHDANAAADYVRLAQFGIFAARESAGWRLIEKHGRFDLTSVVQRAKAAQKVGVQLLWSLMHYGWPADIDIFSPAFVDRFARFCGAVAEALTPYAQHAPRIYTPINEISFFTWALTQTGKIHPYRGDLEPRAGELKQQLVRASIAGADAIWAVDPHARMMVIDPLIHIIAPRERPELALEASRFRDYQFETWDMLSGVFQPELGGSGRYLDIIGINYYHDNQWEHETGGLLHWHLADERRVPFWKLLEEVHHRYRRPLLVAETSHVGDGRGDWIYDVTHQVLTARSRGVPVEGICIYPIVDRPDWETPSHWHNSGLWDLEARDGAMHRRLCNTYAHALWQAQATVTRGLADAARTITQGPRMLPLLVFSHLRWDFVYQRPQHLMTRLAQGAPVLFVEEPVFDERPPFVEMLSPFPNVRVARPHTPIATGGFHDEQLPAMRALLRDVLEREGFHEYAVWFYTPMALPMLQDLRPQAIIYDCMDELTAFRNAPRQLLQRESALLKVANVVFAGGPSLYAAKRDRHANAHCFPSSVDVAHFAKGRDPANAHPALASIASPRLGFFGVIDERFDTGLVGAMAAAHPEWQICLVGPVVKIDPAQLPRAPNIHYFGQQSYEDLPRFVAGWDVCLLPFALNESTRFISPTKTLEYMAAQKPIVSTPVADVVSLYGDCVSLAATPEEFVAACERALAEDEPTRRQREQRQIYTTSTTSWDRTAQAMRTHIQSAAAEGLTPPAHAMLDNTSTPPGVRAMPRVAARTPVHHDCVILGAGPTGLSAGYHYGKGSVVLEKNPSIGGWCRSIDDHGFTFDYAGHIMFSNDPYVLQLYKLLLEDNLHWQNREAWVYSKNVYTRYPFQGALYGLPPDVLKECIIGAIEARFGKLQPAAAVAPAPVCAPVQEGDESQPAVNDCCADGISEATAPLGRLSRAEGTGSASPRNFEEFIYRVWGAGVAKHFAIPYNRKLWTVPLSNMETSWLGGRVPLPNLEEMIDGALQPVAKPMGPNARFGYPLRGGFQALMNGFLPLLKGELELNAQVARVSPAKRTVSLTDGRSYTYETLISTLPLPELIKSMGDEAPAKVRDAVGKLFNVSVRCVNLGIGRENISEKHWIYYPEDTVFHRVFLQGNASPYCNPPGGFGLTCEITYSPYKPLPAEGQALIDRCIADCIRVGLIRADDPIIVANEVDMPYAYVVYDHSRAESVALIREWLSEQQIILAGRYSEWEYFNSDHAFLAGRKAAETARTVLSTVAAEAKTA